MNTKHECENDIESRLESYFIYKIVTRKYLQFRQWGNKGENC